MVWALSACQTPPKDAAPDADAPPRAPVEDSVARHTAPDVSLSAALDLLQGGRESEALEVLEALNAEQPGAVASRLLRQIRAPVEELLPGPYDTITVETGETLSEIAGRVLGDPLMFYALARLNRIEEPRLLAVGETLRVPRRIDAAIAEPAPEISAPVERNARVEDLDIVARYLARSGRPDEAWRMLVLEVESGPGTALAGSLTELTLRHADELRRQERFDDAEQRLLRVIRALAPGDPNQSLLERKLDQVRGGDLISRARRARAEGDLIEAYRLARAAGQTDTGSDARVLAGELRAKLIDSLHNDALVAWRDRDVDRAIRRWETLLESVPDFEPARIYLERARRLRKRLDQS